MTEKNTTQIYQFGEIIFDMHLGELSAMGSDPQRLSPVNAKVLAELLMRSEEVVSRQSIFDAVWPNQVVSDDTLTRCISDIRALLTKLAPGQKIIETLPKRGYRFTASVEQIQSGQGKTAIIGGNTNISESSKVSSFWLQLVGYLGGVLAIATTIVLVMDLLGRPEPNRIALLPSIIVNHSGLAADDIDPLFLEMFVSDTSIEVLSQSAIKSRPKNPFPYFYREFGCLFMIESRITGRRWDVTLVNAETGIVLKHYQQVLSLDKKQLKEDVEAIFRKIKIYIHAHLK